MPPNTLRAAVRVLLAAAVAMLCCCVSPVSAATWYVSQTAGATSSPCGAAAGSPCATLALAASQAAFAAGDTVRVAAGVYNVSSTLFSNIANSVGGGGGGSGGLLVNIVGASASGVRLQCPPAGNVNSLASDMIAAYSAGTVQLAGATLAGCRRIVNVAGAATVKLTSVVITGPLGVGVAAVGGAASLQVTTSLVTGVTGNGIVASGTAQVTLTDVAMVRSTAALLAGTGTGTHSLTRVSVNSTTLPGTSPNLILMKAGNLNLMHCTINSTTSASSAPVLIQYPAAATISGSFLANNRGAMGGAIALIMTAVPPTLGQVVLSLVGSVFWGNSALSGAGGGALYVSAPKFAPNDARKAVVSITSCQFMKNTAVLQTPPFGSGGAIWAQSVTLNIQNSGFSYNSARGNGGAFALSSVASLYLTGTVISHNAAAARGGGIAVFDRVTNKVSGILDMVKVQMSSNLAMLGGGAIAVPAIVADKGNVTALDMSRSFFWQAQDSVFLHNQGGTMGGVFWALSNARIIHHTCMYKFNNATQGGVFALQALAASDVYRSVFNYNSAVFGGVVVSLDDSMLYPYNCTFHYNRALAEGGVAWIGIRGIVSVGFSSMTNNTALRGGVFFGNGDSWLIANYTTLDGNVATQGGGVAYMLGGITIQGSPWFFSQHASYSNNKADYGSVVWASVANVVNMSYIHMSNNTALTSGGAFYFGSGSNSTLWNLYAVNSAANLDGGFMYTTGNTYVYITLAKILRSKAARGGAIFATGQTTTKIFSTTFGSNVAGMGAALHLDGVPYSLINAVVSLQNVVGAWNQAVPPESGVGGFAYVSGTCGLTMTLCMLNNNAAAYGGALYSRGDSTIKLIETTAKFNNASLGGVAVVDMRSKVAFVLSTMSHNAAVLEGGVAISSVTATVTFLQCTVSFSSAALGGVLYTASSSKGVIQGGDFFNNTALAGGALFASDFSTITALGGAKFRLNQALPNNAVSSAGQGGVINLMPTAGFQSVGCTYQQNSAVLGGVIFAYQRPNATATCSQFSSKQDQYLYNAAWESGGVLQWDFNDEPDVDPCAFCDFHVDETGQATSKTCTMVGNHSPQRNEVGIPLVSFLDVQVQMTHSSNSLVEVVQVEPLPAGRIQSAPVRTSPSSFSLGIIENTCASNNYTYNMRVVGSVTDSSPVPADLLERLSITGQDYCGQYFETDIPATLVAKLDVATNTTAGNLQGAVVSSSEIGYLDFNDIIVHGVPGTTLPLTITVIQPPGVDPFNLYLYVRPCRRGETLINSQCRLCEAGKYSYDINEQCSDCPPNTYCAGGDNVTPLDGYWLNPNTDTPLAVECLFKEACRGTVITPSSKELANECAPGYEGILCHECQAGYGRSGQDSCSECPSRGLNIFLLALAAIVAVVVMGVMVYRTRASAGDKTDLLVMMFKVFTSYSQFVSLAAGLNIQWPKALLDFFGLQSKSSSGAGLFVSIDCLAEGSRSKILGMNAFYFQEVLYFLSPWLAAFMICAFWAVNFVYRAVCRRKERKTIRALLVGMRENIIVSLLVVLFFLHPNLSQRTFMLFACRNIGSGSVLAFDTDIDCNSDEYKLFVFAAGIPALILYVIGIPLGAFFVMYVRREHLDTEWFRGLYGFLYNGYQLKFFFWECVIMLRKVAVISVIVLFAQYGTLVQAGVALGLVYGTFHLHEYAQPYQEEVLSKMEKYGLAAAVSIFYTAIFLNVTSEAASKVPESFNVFLTVVMFIVQIAFILYFLYHLKGQLLGKIKETVQGIQGIRKSAREAHKASKRATSAHAMGNLTEAELAEERAYAARMAALEADVARGGANRKSGATRLLSRGSSAHTSTTSVQPNPLNLRTQEMVAMQTPRGPNNV